jgi:hypothetical protein
MPPSNSLIAIFNTKKKKIERKTRFLMEITCDYDASFSPWMAAKHMEAAGVLAKELSCWNEVVDFFKQASALYVECGKVQPGADALIRGARCVTL